MVEKMRWCLFVRDRGENKDWFMKTEIEFFFPLLIVVPSLNSILSVYTNLTEKKMKIQEENLIYDRIEVFYMAFVA